MRNFLCLILSSLFLFSCANTVETVVDESLNGNYKISEIRGKQTISENFIITFNPVGDKVSGNTGCNNFSAHFDQQGRKLEFSTPMNTRKYCEGKMELERQILSSLERATRLERTGQEITIYSESNEALITLTKID
jgi:heat shock protein HslJ